MLGSVSTPPSSRPNQWQGVRQIPLRFLGLANLDKSFIEKGLEKGSSGEIRLARGNPDVLRNEVNQSVNGSFAVNVIPNENPHRVELEGLDGLSREPQEACDQRRMGANQGNTDPSPPLGRRGKGN